MKVVLVVDFELENPDDFVLPVEIMVALRNRLMDYEYKTAYSDETLGRVTTIPEFYK